MSNAKYVGRVGALAIALGVGNVRRTLARMTVSIGVAALVVAATVAPARVSPAVTLSADTTALIVCGTTCPTADAWFMEAIMNQYIGPTHPGQTITPVAVTTPEEYWPITGLLRLVGRAVGDPRLFGPGGAAWPDEPWWKLSGLFDLTESQSVRAGAADIEAAMAAHGNDHLVIYGVSQSAAPVNTVKRKLAEQYPAGTTAPDIDFVLQADPNFPNGGLSSRFPNLYIPILDILFDGPAPTDTQFDTVEISRQYDGASDLPLFPLNFIADLNAVLGFVYLHTNSFDVSLPADPTTSPAYQGTHGDTSYYFFETRDLPLFAPLRQLGVPEALIDVVEPFFRVIVELGYDRSIPLWQPTPARLLPTLNPATVATDLVNAVGEGVTNAAAAIGSPKLPSLPAPITLEAPATQTATADASPQAKSISTPTGTQPTVPEPAESADPSTTETPEPSASTPAPEPLKPARQSAKVRPLVRDSLKVDQPITKTADAGAEDATSAPSPANTASPAAGSTSKPDDSPGADDASDE